MADALREQFAALDAFIVEALPLWSPRPFTERPASWETDAPELSAWLRSLSFAEIDALERDPYAHDAPARLFAELRETGLRRTRFPRAASLPMDTERLKRARWRVPGRKLEQIVAFAGATLPSLRRGPDRFVEWCAGKGHLSRILALELDADAELIEYNAAIAASGAELHERAGARCTYQVADVLTASVDLAGRSAVGLHACGVLSDRLIERVCEASVPVHAHVPCCYHTGHEEGFEPLSEAGRALRFRPDRNALRLSVADEPVAPNRDSHMRRREMLLRTAADLVGRELTGIDRYESLPPLRKVVVRREPEAFLREVLPLRNLELPAGYDVDGLMARATEELRVARALALVRSLFRRPIEVWMVLDQAMRLLESGREVTVEVFCDRRVTPRNLLIRSLA